MIGAQASARQYQRIQVTTMDRGQLLLLVFDGGLRFLTLAEQALREERLADFGNWLGRAQAIIAELLHTLDHERGGEIAVNLDRLYRFMLDHLVDANLQRSVEHVAVVRRLLDTIASGYREILRDGIPELPRAKVA